MIKMSIILIKCLVFSDISITQERIQGDKEAEVKNDDSIKLQYSLRNSKFEKNLCCH